MFRQRPTVINVNAPTEYVTREVNVTERRAPTDESVRLLKEMETAAQAKVDQSIRLDGNGFECVVQIMEDAMSDERVARAVFTVNGRRLDAEARMRRRNANPADLACSLRDAVAKRLAAEILENAICEALQGAWTR